MARPAETSEIDKLGKERGRLIKNRHRQVEKMGVFSVGPKPGPNRDSQKRRMTTISS